MLIIEEKRREEKRREEKRIVPQVIGLGCLPDC
jgi:hypothetical protein